MGWLDAYYHGLDTDIFMSLTCIARLRHTIEGALKRPYGHELSVMEKWHSQPLCTFLFPNTFLRR